jgi:hypothetical protein
VNTLMAAPEQRAAMGRAARARVLSRFSWRHIAEQTLRFYRDLVEGRIEARPPGRRPTGHAGYASVD